MKIPSSPVNTWVEPPLFRSEALRLLFEVLVDHDADTAVISLIVCVPPTDKLVEFVSGPPVPMHNVEARVRELGREFTRMVREHTAPFQ